MVLAEEAVKVGSAEVWVAFFVFLGILVTQVVAFLINRSKVNTVSDKVDRVHDEVRSGNGGSTGKTVDSMSHSLKRFEQRFEERLDDLETKVDEIQEDNAVETASWATIFAAHISDGHDPTGQWTRVRAEIVEPRRRKTDREKREET